MSGTAGVVTFVMLTHWLTAGERKDRDARIPSPRHVHDECDPQPMALGIHYRQGHPDGCYHANCPYTRGSCRYVNLSHGDDERELLIEQGTDALLARLVRIYHEQTGA